MNHSLREHDRGKTIVVISSIALVAVLVAVGNVVGIKERVSEILAIWELETGDYHEQIAALERLQECGSEWSVPYVVEKLRGGDAYLKMEAAAAVIEIGPDAREAVPALTEILEEDDDLLWLYAIAALSTIGPRDSEIVPVLKKFIEKCDPIGQGHLVKGATGLIERIERRTSSSRSTRSGVR